MLDNVDVPGSDGWWFRHLSAKFTERPVRPDFWVGDSRRAELPRNQWLEMLWQRMIGNTPLLTVNEKYAKATQEFMRLSRTQFAETIVSSLQDRTQWLGAKTVAPTGSDADGDDTIRRFMTANGTFFSDALTYSYAMGDSTIIVAPPQEGEDVATATAEDPRQMVVDVDPIRPLRVRAALKIYRDVTMGEDVARLYLSPRPGATGPEALYRIRTARRSIGATWTLKTFRPTDWTWDDSPEWSGPIEHQELGLPVVPMPNRFGLGEFETVVDLLDRIHNDVADRLWMQKFQVFIQRAAMGKFPEKDKQGQTVDYDSIFEADPGALWLMPEGSSLWEGKQADLTGILAAVKSDLMELSATTKTSMFMFMPDALAGSAAGANAAVEGSVNKAKDRLHRFSPRAIRVSQLALAYSGKPDIAKGEITPMWAPVFEDPLSERANAAVAGKNAGMPFRSIMSDVMKFDPATVARMEKERDEDLLFAAPAPALGQPARSGAPAPAGAPVAAPAPATPPPTVTP